MLTTTTAPEKAFIAELNKIEHDAERLMGEIVMAQMNAGQHIKPNEQSHLNTLMEESSQTLFNVSILKMGRISFN